jgi:hypothetical protein
LEAILLLRLRGQVPTVSIYKRQTITDVEMYYVLENERVRRTKTVGTKHQTSNGTNRDWNNKRTTNCPIQTLQRSHPEHRQRLGRGS